jgi:protein-L-isoaspartate(D-aspartate) O-methyltransferase
LPVLFVPMTGAAEEQRQVLPDLDHPTIVNGGFEESSGDPPKPSAWHYQRYCKLTSDEGAPEGSHYLTFSNSEPGRGAAALQGLSLDGRHVRELELSAWVRARNIQVGFEPNQAGDVALILYDERRNSAGEIPLGPWYGESEWKHISRRFVVPNNAREAILRIGLFGGTGQLDLDDIQLKVLKRPDASQKRAR